MSAKIQNRHILTIDCCKHLLDIFNSIPAVNLTSISSKNHLATVPDKSINLIIVGISRYPIRRLFFNRLRHFFPITPMLILRREKIDRLEEKEGLRGEFLLSDEGNPVDLEIISAVRNLLPLKPCKHVHHSSNYDLVREVIYILSKNYEDPQLNLQQVADEIPISPSKLSRILNQQVGISFRQLLRQIRIEEAKTMLATHNYSVKEIAARVGFSDSHYFSKSFKEVTGLSATEYEYSIEDFVFN